MYEYLTREIRRQIKDVVPALKPVRRKTQIWFSRIVLTIFLIVAWIYLRKSS